MANKQIWVSPRGGQWIAQRPGADRAIMISDTKDQVYARARKIAQNQHLELIVQRHDGVIHQKNSYGSDPRWIKG